MAGKTNIVRWASGPTASLQEIEAYKAKAVTGLVPGIADLEQANRSWLQATAVAAAVASVITKDAAHYTGVDVNDDDTDEEIATKLLAAICGHVPYEIASGSIAGEKIADGAIIASKIGASAVTADKMAANSVASTSIQRGAVTEEKLGANAVTAVKIKALAVTTEKINTKAVTADKMADNSVNSSAIQNSSVTEAKIATNAVTGTKIANGAVTNEKIADGAIIASKIGASAVTADKMAANSVASTSIQRGAVTEEKLGANAVTAVKIKALAVTTEKINTKAVTADKMADNSVNSSAIQNSSVTEAKIATNAVTGTKIANGAVTNEKIADRSINAPKIAAGAVGPTQLADSGVTAGSVGPTAAAKLAFGGSFNVPQVTVDSKGRVTKSVHWALKLPDAPAFASQAEAEAGTVSNKYMSPLRTKQAIGKLASAVPPGTMIHFAGKTLPSGWLICNGAAVSRTTYADLYKAIGTTYGAGDGSTTFNLPNANGRFLECTTSTSSVGKKIEAGVPNISGKLTSSADWFMHADGLTASGALTVTLGSASHTSHSGGGGSFLKSFDLSGTKSSSRYGSSSTVQPASLRVLVLIKA